jgi:tetratricopeptide (TPR) repeat protein
VWGKSDFFKELILPTDENTDGSNPQDAIAYNSGLAYARLDQNEMSIHDYDEAIRLDPQDTRFYINRSVHYATLGQYEKGIQDFDEAIRIDPQYVVPTSTEVLRTAC